MINERPFPTLHAVQLFDLRSEILYALELPLEEARPLLKRLGRMCLKASNDRFFTQNILEVITTNLNCELP